MLGALILALPAGEAAIDPWATLDPRHQFTCLAKIESSLASSPDDQRLLGLAISAYVHLALPAPRLLTGDPGSLLAKADVLRERRIRLRGDAPPADLASALPELWLAALHGDTRLAMDGLARFPAAETDPTARALRTFATRDWRGIAAQAERTPLENYALAWAMASSGFFTNEQVMGLKGRGLSSPALNAVLPLYRFAGWSSELITASSAVVADACWLFGSPSLTDARALELATRFHQLANWPLPTGETRDVMRRRMLLTARNPGDNVLRPLLAAWWLCDHLARDPAARRGTLVSLADAARWNRDRVLPLLIVCAQRDASDAEPGPQELADRKLIADAGDGLLQRWSALRWGASEVDPAWPITNGADCDEDTRTAAITALTSDLTDARGHSTGVCWDLLVHLSLTGPVGDLPQRLAGPHGPDLIQRRRWCALIAGDHGEPDADFRRRLADWCARDPWDPELNLWQVRWSPTTTRLAFGLPPLATWTDATIDNPRLPAPQDGTAHPATSALHDNFLIRWDGWIRLPQAGRWRFSVASDDGSRLTIGDAVVDQWHYQELTTRGVDWECQAGWQPLRVDFYQGHDGAACRLLWRPPGTSEDRVVPAEFLAHGAQHEPGLSASCWPGHGDVFQPLPGTDQDAWLRERPWLLHDWIARGRVLANLGRWAEAVSWLDAVIPTSLRVIDLDHSALLGVCLLMRDPPPADLARAVTLVASYYPTALHGQDVDSSWLVADRVAMLGMTDRLRTALAVPECRDRRQWDSAWHVLHGQCALRQGDFAAALINLRWFGAKDNSSTLDEDRRRLVILQDLALARLEGERGIDLDQIEKRLGEADLARSPGDALASDYLTGRCDAATALTRAAKTTKPTEIGYWLGLQALAEHRFVDARAHWASAATGQGTIALSAAALVAWFDRQTPDQLAARPKRAPIPRRVPTVKPGTPAGGADDF